jgi:hypothetical protein
MRIWRWLVAKWTVATSACERILGWFGFGITRYRIQAVEDLPEQLQPHVLYVVTQGSVRVYAAMTCPRQSCRDTVNMNLIPDDYPVWRLNVEQGGLASLHPSVWRKTGCGCHFWLRNGKVRWC